MIKTIRIENKDVQLNNNIGWALIYRDQFGRDIIPALMPALASALDLVSGIIKETGKTKNIDLGDLLAVMDGDSFLDALVHLSGLEFVDFVNITWAMAKCADDSLPDPRKWVTSFEVFSLDVIAPSVIELMVKSVISSKNLERLRSEIAKIKTTQPLISIQSSSPESSED